MNNGKKYKISFVNNLKSSLLIIGLLLVFTGFNFYLYMNHPYYNLNVFLYSMILILPLVGPATFVHAEYWIQDRNKELEIDNTQRKLRYKDEKKEIKAGFDDITRIIKHQVKDTALLFGFYKYHEIHLQSGEILIITILMAREFSIPGIEIEIVDRYFPSVWWYNNFSS